MYAIALIATCTKPPTSRAKEDDKLRPPFTTVPCTPGAKTMAKCAIGVARPATTLKNVTPSATADTAYDMVMTELTAFALTTYATSSRTVRFTPLTPTSNVATALPLMMTLISKGR